MIRSDVKKTYPEESPLYPGWPVVFICQIGVLTGFAAVFIYSFTLMVKPWQQEFGWSREQISEGFTLAALSVAVCSPFMGKLFDRFEPRKIIAGMMTAFGIGIASMAWLTPNLGRFYATAVFLGVAGSGTYQLGYARIVASWFDRRLGIALSLMIAGSGFGTLFFPPLVQHSIAVHGWRHTYLFLAALPLLAGAPLTFLFAPIPGSKPQALSAEATSGSQAGVTWREGLGARSFWLIALGVGCMSLAENGAFAHLVPMLSDRGIRAQDAALVVSVLGGSSLAGRLLLGWLLDFLEGSHIAAASLFVAGLGIFLLGQAQSLRAAVMAALIAGLGLGCEFDLMPYMLKRYFGMRSFSTLYGVIYSVYAVAGGTAPLLLGRAYDITGSYTRLITVFSGFTAAAAVAMLALPAYVYSMHSGKNAAPVLLEAEAANEAN